ERKKTKTVTDRVISDICREFSVNEDWLRFGKGEIFIKPETFSLDEYAKLNGLNSLEFDIIKSYIELDAASRHKVLSHFKNIFDKHAEISAAKENEIDRQIGEYRLELEAEKKGLTSPVCNDIKGA
ncbi:MAG: hypothetical protein ACYDG2_04665, partial [Ruminiclostridium sp.]